MKQLLFFTLLFTNFLTPNVQAYFKEANLRATDGTEIHFSYEIVWVEGNGRGMDRTWLENLRISFQGDHLPNPFTNTHPGAATLFWHRSCNFPPPTNDAPEDYQKTYELEYYALRGSIPLLTTQPDTSMQILRLTTPDRLHYCNWTQSIEITINGRQLIDPVNNSPRFQINFNY